MSRSVNYLNDAIAIAFVTTEEFSGIEPCDLDCQEFFKEAADDVAARLREKWPSFEEADSWDNRETRIVAENYHAVVGVSEYCGLTSVSIAVNDSSEQPELAESWICRMSDEFRQMFGTLRKVGTFSNGESVFERAG